MSSHHSEQLFSDCTVPLFVLHCGAESVIKAENSRNRKNNNNPCLLTSLLWEKNISFSGVNRLQTCLK